MESTMFDDLDWKGIAEFLVKWKDIAAILALIVSLLAFIVSSIQYRLAKKSYRMNSIITAWKEANSSDIRDGMRIAEGLYMDARRAFPNQDLGNEINNMLSGLANNVNTYNDYVKVYLWIEFFSNIVYMKNEKIFLHSDIVNVFRHDLAMLRNNFLNHIRDMSGNNSRSKFTMLHDFLLSQRDL
jgi:hypothetical protein